MSRIRSYGNKDTELALVRVFRLYGITGWRRHQSLLGRPDFVFPNERLVVFVDGCFWHGCRIHSKVPKTNRAYWSKKLLYNQRRDRRVACSLRRKGWRVMRIWEHDLVSKHENRVLHRVLKTLGNS